MFGLDHRLEHILSFSAKLNPPEVIGPTPEGIRVNFYCVGGEVEGPSIRAKVRPVGGDWALIRRDGVGILDVRATMETEDGALIHVSYPGIADFGEDGYERFLRGEAPPTLQLRVSPRFQTANPDYLWLNRLFCVGVGVADLATLEVRYDIYALR